MTAFPLNLNQNLISCLALLKTKNKKISLKMALDTGASLTMVSFDSATAIGIDPAQSNRKVNVTTGNGVIWAPIIIIPRFQTLGQEIKNLEVVVHDLPREGIVDGLIGLNFLKHFHLSLNFIDKTMEILPPHFIC